MRWLRIVSALVLAPLPVAAIWFGWPWLPLLTGLAAAVMAWEWGRLCRGGHFGRTGILLVVVVLAAVVAASLVSTGAGSRHRPARRGAGFMGGAQNKRCRRPNGQLSVRSGLLCLASASYGWRAMDSPAGRHCYGCWSSSGPPISALTRSGGIFGGPRLAPRWSPRKTWAGLAGGMVCAALVGWATAAWLQISPAVPLATVSSGLAIVEQFGDLAEFGGKAQVRREGLQRPHTRPWRAPRAGSMGCSR